MSDRYGRRPLLLFCTGFLALDFVIMATAPNVWMLLVGRILAGIAGASIVPALASAADVSEPSQKTRNFAVVYSAVGIGMILGSLLAGLVVRFGTRAPFWLSVCVAVANFLLILFFFPETLKPERRRPFEFTNPVRSIRSLSQHDGLLPFFFSLFVYMLAFQAPITLLSFYSKGHLGWSDDKISWIFLLNGFVMLVAQVAQLPLFHKLLGNKKLYYFSYLLFVSGLFVMGVVQTGEGLVAGIVLIATSSIANSVNSNIFSSQVSPKEQGEVQGAMSSVYSLGSVARPVLASVPYRHFSHSGLPLGGGLVFVAASVLAVGALFLSVKVFSRMKDNPALNDRYDPDAEMAFEGNGLDALAAREAAAGALSAEIAAAEAEAADALEEGLAKAFGEPPHKAGETGGS